MKNSYFAIILLVFMFITNPTRENHIDNLQSELKNTNIMLSLASPLMELVHYKDFYIFSITQYEDSIFSIGLFGKVIVSKNPQPIYSKKK